MTSLASRPRRSRPARRLASLTALVAAGVMGGSLPAASTAAQPAAVVAQAQPAAAAQARPAAVVAQAQPAAAGAVSAARATRRTQEPGVTANLFEWNWRSVARECTTVLGPNGYAGVQVSAPADSLKRTALGNGSDTVLHPWWEIYQPVSYALTSRMGTEAEFKTMVATCRKAGVKVYADAVLNHMTGQGETSYGGVNYGHKTYPGLYDDGDFHALVSSAGAGPNDCTSSNGGIDDFNNVRQVRKCELLGLADLRTESAEVRATLAAYLNKLIGYGVSGFRVDAAKHIGQADLTAIYALINNTKDGVRPYWALEVFGGGPGILSPQAFTSAGDVLGLDGVKQIRDAFNSYPDAHLGSIASLEVFGADSGLTPGDKTLSFVTNHDTERNGDALTYKHGARYLLATMWLLAEGYGSPQVFSGFSWAQTDDSPPSDAEGLIADATCSTGKWTCTHRKLGVAGLVRWHNYVGAATKRNVFTDGDNVLAFSKGRRGWAGFNNGSSAQTITVATGLPAGRYCDVVHSTLGGGRCSGGVAPIVVGANGRATVTLGALDAVAIDRAHRL